MSDKSRSKYRTYSIKDKASKDSSSWTCQSCKKVFNDSNCNVLECERCCDHFCAKCIKVGDTDHVFMSSRADVHWFYSKCDGEAMKSVLSDKDLETKISNYVKAINDKLADLEMKVSDKRDKKVFDLRIEKHVLKNTDTVNSLKAEIFDLRRSHADFEKGQVAIFISLRGKKMHDLADKI